MARRRTKKGRFKKLRRRIRRAVRRLRPKRMRMARRRGRRYRGRVKRFKGIDVAVTDIGWGIKTIMDFGIHHMIWQLMQTQTPMATRVSEGFREVKETMDADVFVPNVATDILGWFITNKFKPKKTIFAFGNIFRLRL